MLDLESMISAQRVMCVKRCVENYGNPWKYVLDFYLKKVGGKFLFQCNFDYLSITLPFFYRECLQAWSSMTNYDSTSYEGIMNQIIWKNKYILSQGKSIFRSFFYNLQYRSELIEHRTAFLTRRFKRTHAFCCVRQHFNFAL